MNFSTCQTGFFLQFVSFERFLKAVNRCISASSTPSVSESILAPPLRKEEDFIFFKTDRTFIKVLLDEISYVEAYGNYVKVHLTDKTWVVSEKISTICDNLNATEFIRVHKSYIVSLTKIEQLENNIISIKKALIPVSDTYRKVFLEAFKGRFNA